MIAIKLMLAYITILSYLCIQVTLAKLIRIGIVGGGISAASTLYFLRLLHNESNVKHNITLLIDLYESSHHLGGRLQSISYPTSSTTTNTNNTNDTLLYKSFELGGSIIHEENKYMKTFVKYLNLTKIIPERTNSRLSIYNQTNNQFVLSTTNNNIINMYIILSRYGFKSFFKLRKLIKNVGFKVNQFYTLFDSITTTSTNTTTLIPTFTTSTTTSNNSSGNLINNKYYKTVPDLLKAVDLYDMTQISLYDWLLINLFNTNSNTYTNTTTNTPDRNTNTSSSNTSKNSNTNTYTNTNHTSVNTLNNKEYKLVYELITSAIRVNYNQKVTMINALAHKKSSPSLESYEIPPKINGPKPDFPAVINVLAGAIGLIPLVDSSIWAVREGNYRVVYDMLTLLVNNVYIKHRVNSITYNRHNSDPYTIEGTRPKISQRPTTATCTSNTESGSDTGTCTTEDTCTNNDGDKFKAVYDIVIICTPLENANISFTITQSSTHNSEDPSVQPAIVDDYYPRMYQSTYATFLQGHLLNTSSLYLAASSNNTLATYLPTWSRPLIRWLGWLKINTDSIQLPGTLLTVEPPTDNDTNKGQKYDGYISSIGSYYTDSSTSSDNNGTIYKLFSRTLIPYSTLSSIFNISNNTPIINASGSVCEVDYSGRTCSNTETRSTDDLLSQGNSTTTSSVVIKYWAAYPVFNPPELFTPFELTLTTPTTTTDKQQVCTELGCATNTSGDGDSNNVSIDSATNTDNSVISEGESNRGLYYTNTFENAFSCMEGQAIAGRNTAGLAWEYILGREGSEL